MMPLPLDPLPLALVCSDCDGTGRVFILTIDEVRTVAVECCDECDGTGEVLL